MTTLPDSLVMSPEGEVGRWAGLAGRQHRHPCASGRSLVLLHGLTFDHRMWDPIIDALHSEPFSARAGPSRPRGLAGASVA
jgi:pimeloyl-ACP methyl ester carboxylesterase